VAVPTHFKFVVRGHFIGSPETWSFSTKYSRNVTAGPDITTDDVDEGACTAAVTALIANSHISSAVAVDDWRMYQMGTNNRLEDPTGPLLHLFPFETVKGTGTIRFPPQVSLVITSVAVNRGPAKKGRFYLPGPADAINSDGRYTDAQAAAYRTLASTFTKAVSDAIDYPLGESSEGLNISEGPPGSTTGTKQTIEHYECGRALDTLRNRRKSLLEEWNVGGHIDW